MSVLNPQHEREKTLKTLHYDGVIYEVRQAEVLLARMTLNPKLENGELDSWKIEWIHPMMGSLPVLANSFQDCQAIIHRRVTEVSGEAGGSALPAPETTEQADDNTRDRVTELRDGVQEAQYLKGVYKTIKKAAAGSGDLLVKHELAGLLDQFLEAVRARGVNQILGKSLLSVSQEERAMALYIYQDLDA